MYRFYPRQSHQRRSKANRRNMDEITTLRLISASFRTGFRIPKLIRRSNGDPAAELQSWNIMQDLKSELERAIRAWKDIVRMKELCGISVSDRFRKSKSMALPWKARRILVKQLGIPDRKGIYQAILHARRKCSIDLGYAKINASKSTQRICPFRSTVPARIRR